MTRKNSSWRNLRPVAQKNVQMALIVEKIAEAEGIRCEDKDFDAYCGEGFQKRQPAVGRGEEIPSKRGNGIRQGMDPVRKDAGFFDRAAKVEAA